MARSEPALETADLRRWLSRPAAQDPGLDAATYEAMAEMLLWELGQIGGPEHNLERFCALMQALSAFLAGVTIAEDDAFVKTASLSVGVDLYATVMEFRAAAARDGHAVGGRDGR